MKTGGKMKKILFLLVFVLVGCKINTENTKIEKTANNAVVENKSSEEVILLHPLDVINPHTNSYQIIKKLDELVIDFKFDVAKQYNQLASKVNLVERFSIIVELDTDEEQPQKIISPVTNELVYNKGLNQFILKDKIKVKNEKAIFNGQDVVLKILFLDSENAVIHQNSIHVKIIE